MAVVAPDSLRAVTDPAAVVLAADVPRGAELAAAVASDLPLSDVCALLYGEELAATCHKPRCQEPAGGQGTAAAVSRTRGQHR